MEHWLAVDSVGKADQTSSDLKINRDICAQAGTHLYNIFLIPDVYVIL